MPPHIVAEWYRAHQRALCAYLVKYTRLQRADAEDVMIRVWIRLLRLVDESEIAAPVSFLKKVAFNEAQEFCARSCRRRPHHDLNEFSHMEDGMGYMPEQLVEHHDPFAILAGDKRTERIVGAVRLLPPRQLEAITRHHFDGLTYKQVADELGLSYRQILRDLTKAHHILRLELADESERPHRDSASEWSGTRGTKAAR